MAPRKPSATTNAPTATPKTSNPSLTSSPSNGSQLSALSLPDSLDIQLPDFASQVPTDFFRPSSSSVPRTDSATFKQESLIAAEQSNSLQLQSMNLDNVVLTVGNAVKATKIGDLLMQYQIGIETIRTSSVKLLNQQQLTVNMGKQLLITTEKGRGLDVKLQGEQLKTQLEDAKNNILAADVQGYQQLLPIAEQSWKYRLEQASNMNAEMLQKLG